MRVWPRLAGAAALALAAPAGADRIVLAPRGLVMPPLSLKVEALVRNDGNASLGWTRVGLPGEDLGLEVEIERAEVRGRVRQALSLQYTLTGNLFTDLVPALSLGVRDAGNSGREGRAFFAAATKTVGLSAAQELVVRRVDLHAAAGTGSLEGIMLGLDVRLRAGPTVSAEYLARRLNAAVSVPLGPFLSARVCSIDGEPFFGAVLSLRR